ncbi:MAG: hydrogenase iron-sulfur subunit [Thermoplasmata archaeon]|nr:MAG: hydrogenase iron-sulfur subunit [Thermoplasmata archaeon]
MVTGCKLDECHYISGNFRAKEQIETTQQILDMIGLKGGRLEGQWLSASEGEKFANTVSDFVEKIKDLGPNPLRIEKEGKRD